MQLQKHPTRCLLLFAGLPVCEPANAAEFSRYLTVTTDYVFRGVTYSDGHPAAQLGVDLAFENGFHSGVWASTVDIGVEPYNDRDLEVDYYLGYRHDLSSNWSVGGNFAAYTFPGAAGSIDYDYEEYALNINYGDRAWLEYAWSPDLPDLGRHAHDVSVYTEWPFVARNRIGGGVGYSIGSDLTGDNYAYWQLGVTRPYGQFALDLRYHDTSRRMPYVSSADRTGSRIVLSFRLEF